MVQGKGKTTEPVILHSAYQLTLLGVQHKKFSLSLATQSMVIKEQIISKEETPGEQNQEPPDSVRT